MDFFFDSLGRRRQAQQINEARERLANETSNRLWLATLENQRAADVLTKLVKEMQGRVNGKDH